MNAPLLFLYALLFSCVSLARADDCTQSFSQNDDLLHVSKKVVEDLGAAPFAGEDNNWYYSGQVQQISRLLRPVGGAQWSVRFQLTKTSTRVSACEGCMPIVEKSCMIALYRLAVSTVNGCPQPKVERKTEFMPHSCLTNKE